MKKPWFKRWKVWGGVFIVIAILGAIAPDPEEEAAKPEVAAAAETKEAPKSAPTEEELAAIAKEAEEKAKADQAKWEAEQALKAEADAAEKAMAEADREFARNSLDEAYDRFISESEGIIVKITPEDDYEIINVQLTDDFVYVPVELKQAFVDDFGNKIENRTRGAMFEGRGSKDFLYVYFVNSRGEHLVSTNHFDKGWKAK